MLQNLRIGLRKRQKGKSDMPVKQHGKWQDASWNWRKNSILLAFGELVSTFAINNKTRRKRICCGLRCVDAHDQQKGFEFRWIGNRDDIKKSDDGYNSQRWSAATTNAPSFNKPITIHCKTGSLSARLVFETRAKCQDFVALFKDDGIPYAVDSPFCNTSTNITVRQPKSLEEREIGRRVAPLWEALAAKLHEIFPERDAGDFSLSLRSTSVHKYSTFWIAGTAVGETGFQTCTTWTRSSFCSQCSWSVRSTHSWWCIATGHLSSQPSGSEPSGLCVMAALLPPRLFAACRGSNFRGFPAWWALHFAIYLARCLTLHDSVPRKREVSQNMCCRPHTYVNPYWRKHNNLTKLIWHATGSCHLTLSHARKWDPCPLSGLWLHLEDSTSPVFHRRGKMQMMDILKTLILLLHIYVGGAMNF